MSNEEWSNVKYGQMNDFRIFPWGGTTQLIQIIVQLNEMYLVWSVDFGKGYEENTGFSTF